MGGCPRCGKEYTTCSAADDCRYPYGEPEKAGMERYNVRYYVYDVIKNDGTIHRFSKAIPSLEEVAKEVFSSGDWVFEGKIRRKNHLGM